MSLSYEIDRQAVAGTNGAATGNRTKRVQAWKNRKTDEAKSTCFAHNPKIRLLEIVYIANAIIGIVVTIIRAMRSSVRPKRKDFTTRVIVSQHPNPTENKFRPDKHRKRGLFLNDSHAPGMTVTSYESAISEADS